MDEIPNYNAQHQISFITIYSGYLFKCRISIHDLFKMWRCKENELLGMLEKYLELGERTLPWAIWCFRIFLNYLSQKFEKYK